MHSNNEILYLILILILQFFSTSGTSSKDSICNNTPFPQFCKSILPPNNSASTQDHGRFSIQNSISMTKTLLLSVNGYLVAQASLSIDTIHALEDCQFLCNLNIDFFSNTLETIQTTGNLDSSRLDDLLTLLSATLTNHQTCLEGLEALTSSSNPKNALKTQLSDGSMTHSVSLAIFKQGWVSNGRKNARKLASSITLYPGGRSVLVNKTVVVNPNGSGDFTTINAALASAPNNTDGSRGYFVIHVVAGVYKEYVNIGKTQKYIMMTGDGINKTIITGNRSVGGGWTTFNSATFIVVGKGFVGVNITIQNTAGAANNQAVALRGDSDLSTFYRCSFEGYQDTLYTHSLRQFYRECDIYGTVDFIFGNAAVVLQNCNIYPRLPMQGQFDTLTAQGKTDINQNTGTSIQNCTITQAENLGSTQTYLGRPWKQYSTVVYMQSFMDSLINPAGWSIWSGTFALNTCYYAEFNNTGPGSNTAKRVTWSCYHVINATTAANFTVSNFISGDSWLPATGVPYYGGLL